MSDDILRSLGRIEGTLGGMATQLGQLNERLDATKRMQMEHGKAIAAARAIAFFASGLATLAVGAAGVAASVLN